MLILILISITLAYLSISHKKWWPIMVATVILGVLSVVQLSLIYGFAHDVYTWFERNLNICVPVLFIISLTVAAALWVNQWEVDRKDKEQIKQRKDNLSKITTAGYLEEKGYPQVPEWNEYINNVAHRLSKTRLEGESFALGIAGDWGSGKTTFLRQLRNELQKTFIVIDFNPWVCTSSKVVFSDFFRTLSNSFPNDKELMGDVKKYVQLLTEVEVMPGLVSKLADAFLPEDNDSITSLKSQIETKLNEADERYLVLIDDLDRLEHQELFEVLRLIRITASFSNLLFVVTYDKHHINDMLKANQISNGELFVKKIFNTEIVLPELEPYLLPKMLMDEITRLLGDSSRIPVAISNAVFLKDSMNVYSIGTYLKNYRDVKRFAMAFATEAFNIEQKNPQEFSFDEFFWLNMLRYSDYETYCKLRTYPTAFLKEESTILSLKEDVNLKDESKDILTRLFTGSMASKPANSIRYKNNYHNYFSFRIQKDKVSIAEFNQLLMSDGAEISQAINDFWSQNRIASLLDVLKQTQPNNLNTLQEKKNYISVLIGLTVCTNKYYIPYIKEKLQQYLYPSEEERNELANHTMELINGLIVGGNVKVGYINELLSKLHSVAHYAQEDEDVQYNFRSIVSDEFLVEQSNVLLKKMLEKLDKTLSICNITKQGKFREYLEAATVNFATDVTYEPVEEIYKCLPFKELLTYFTIHKSDQLDEFMKPIKFDDEELEYADDDCYFEGRIASIEKIVGSVQNFKSLITECFVNSDEEKESWLKYWRIVK